MIGYTASVVAGLFSLAQLIVTCLVAVELEKIFPEWGVIIWAVASLFMIEAMIVAGFAIIWAKEAQKH